MATFPQGFEAISKRCNTGERKVLHALKRLEDDYCVWHNVPLGPKGRQPDFVILNSRRGVLLLEVKDWKLSTLRAANPDGVELDTARGRITEANPLRQARDYALELVTVMQRDCGLVNGHGAHKGKLIFPYGWGAVFSGIKRAELEGTDFADVFPAGKVMLQDDLAEHVATEAFQERLWQMFNAPFSCNLTLPQRDRIRWHLFPEIRINQQTLPFKTPAETDIELLDLMQVMDLQQEQLARSLGDGHRVIHGVAGSGKTMLLIFRAEQLARAAVATKPILVLCYNKALAGRLENILRARGVDERVVVQHFHGWCADLVKTYHIEVPEGDSKLYERQAWAVCNSIGTDIVPSGQYTAILIDEGHDFENEWLTVAAKMVDPASESLLVLYDDGQAIYKKNCRRTSFSSLGIKAIGRTNILKINYRNTAEVLLLAMRVAGGGMLANDATEDTVPVVLPKSGGRRGPLPILIEASSAPDEANRIAEAIGDATANGTSINDIAVFCRSRTQMVPIEHALKRRGITFASMSPNNFKRFDWSHDSVKIVTLHSCKGLEFPFVFVAGLQALPMKNESEEDELRLLYVGMTRATDRLVLSTSGKSSVVDRVRTAMRELEVGLKPAPRVELKQAA